jgi:regulatory protein
LEDYKKALNYSFLLLKYRPRSRAELIARLKRKKISSGSIKKVIGFLEEYNYINDEDFARGFVSSCRNKGWGPKRIFINLKKLGVDEQLIDKNLKKKKDYSEEIKELIEKRMNRYKGKNKYQKILRFLLNRGFYYRDIVSQLQEMGVDRFED